MQWVSACILAALGALCVFAAICFRMDKLEANEPTPLWIQALGVIGFLHLVPLMGLLWVAAIG
jgi:hypothetical protein